MSDATVGRDCYAGEQSLPYRSKERRSHRLSQSLEKYGSAPNSQPKIKSDGKTYTLWIYRL